MSNKIKITTNINAPMDQVWGFWIGANHIKNWYFASDDWHVPKVVQDFHEGKNFSISMAAKDQSFAFDFAGKYTNIEEFSYIEYILEDGRKVKTTFVDKEIHVVVTQEFDPESENPVELQRDGWQAILNNFKKYVEE